MSEQATDKVCPDCAETVKAEARVCRFCGHRFDSAPASAAPVAATTASDLVTTTSFAARQWFLIWAAASALFMLIGAFGPWLKALGQTVSGTDGGNDGWLIVAAAVIATLLLFATRRNRGAGLWALIAGAISAAVAIHDRSHASNAISHGGALLQAVAHIGWGLNLAMVASISFAVAGLSWLFAIPSEQAPHIDPGVTAGTASSGTPMMRRDPASGQWIKVYVDEDEPVEAPPSANA